MKNSYITITDQFCGAGGSSQGARRLSQRVKGIQVKQCGNAVTPPVMEWLLEKSIETLK